MTEQNQKQLGKPLWNIADCLSPLDAEIAVSRVAERVRQGGHSIPEPVIRRRLVAGLRNFTQHYRQAVNLWMMFGNAGSKPVLLDEGTNP